MALKMKELISVIVPVCNCEKYIEICIRSVLQQTYTNLELILVDDGSTDGSSEVCKELSKKYDNITYLIKKMEVFPLLEISELMKLLQIILFVVMRTMFG